MVTELRSEAWQDLTTAHITQTLMRFQVQGHSTSMNIWFRTHQPLVLGLFSGKENSGVGESEPKQECPSEGHRALRKRGKVRRHRKVFRSEDGIITISEDEACNSLNSGFETVDNNLT